MSSGTIDDIVVVICFFLSSMVLYSLRKHDYILNRRVQTGHVQNRLCTTLKRSSSKEKQHRWLNPCSDVLLTGSTSVFLYTHHRLGSSLNCQDLISDGELDTLHFSFIVHSVEEHEHHVSPLVQRNTKWSLQNRYSSTGSGTWRQHCSCHPGLWPPPLWLRLNAPQTPAARKQEKIYIFYPILVFSFKPPKSSDMSSSRMFNNHTSQTTELHQIQIPKR